MSPPVMPSMSLTITNPLVLYRALLSTKKIHADPAQHRLALQLQKLYFRLKDYEPEVEFRWRLERALKLAGKPPSPNANGSAARENQREERRAVDEAGRPLKKSWFGGGDGDGNRAVTRTIPLHDSAMEIDSPQGMLLYGEVGRGKSMLLDLLYDSLPTKKKRRWHFNTFMLDIFRRLELARIEKSLNPASTSAGFGVSDHEHVVLGLARETMETSPILFLDEFQLPDRVAGRLMNGFLMAFFHLGGVLVASSNRMPEELAKAQGVEFSRMGRGGDQNLWNRMMKGMSEGQVAARTDFGVFVEVLKRRCEVWEMEGERDWRREDRYDGAGTLTQEEKEMERELLEEAGVSSAGIELLETSSGPESGAAVVSTDTTVIAEITSLSSDTPAHYHVSLSPSTDSEEYEIDLRKLNPTDEWVPTTLSVYARGLTLPVTSPEHGIAVLPFSSLCAANLGPADYISICSTFHTLVVTSIPVLTLLQKNEARRFITLLDACYESRCRLLISAAAPPDRLFFPETRTKSGAVGAMLDDGTSSDSIDSEAFSEMYQDSTAPFRPNVSIYDEVSSAPTMTIGSGLRTVLADEDADFGPTYGNGRGHGPSNDRKLYEDDNDFMHDERSRAPTGFEELEKRQGPDFTQTGALTGEDERFAYKRARSRLWEMCGRKWWDERESRAVEEWWTPVRREGRFWEASTANRVVDDDVLREATRTVSGEGTSGKVIGTTTTDETLFRHGASPFRKSADPPPKFGWQHAWGMMTWGKKAGEWGKGVEGDRKKGREDQSRS